ncbi:MAG: hypothetical protein ACK4UO_09105 [Pseudolabrys sp.]
MLCRAGIAVAALVLALFAVAPARAQNCGSPPDPRVNTAGYASWCSCMGGVYNYQTTACVGARGPRTGGATYSENWGCFAQARNGASGNSWGFASEGEARSRALSECRARGGPSCAVRYCQRGTSAGNAPGRQRTAPPPRLSDGGVVDTGNWGCYAQAANGRGGYSWGFASEGEARTRALSECRAHSGQASCTVRACQPGTSAQLLPSKRPVAGTQRRAPEQSSTDEVQAPAGQRAPRYACAVCERKLDADLRTGLSSARPRSFVQQVIAGYENCKQKAFQPCFLGDIQARSVTNACSGFTRDADFKACLGRVLGQ